MFVIRSSQCFSGGLHIEDTRNRRTDWWFLLFAVFAGKDASRALAQSSLKIEDCRPDYEDLDDKEQKVLNDWFTFFSKRYNIIGKVQH